jgi:hypothetical protein
MNDGGIKVIKNRFAKDEARLYLGRGGNSVGMAENSK